MENGMAFPPVYMMAIVSPQVYAVLLATYGVRSSKRASSDSHSCANSRGWCRQPCFSHEYVDRISSVVCGRYKCCSPK
ncbi:hypothetical protein ACJMK2_018040 [Sinanodonta woodiana]|uniref:Beta-defensin n=1 Tax=Sinanodonta woodiana TaxID=1069815 RepID=A0ABD3UDP9_SINWO